MAVTTVVPNATASGAGNFTITGGSPSINAALSDNDDATYIMKTSSIVGQAGALLDFGTTTLTSSQRVRKVRIRARCSTPTTSGKINVALGVRADNQNYFHSPLAIRGQNASATTFVGPYFTSAPNGQSWSQSLINGLRGKITEYADSSDIGKFYELFIDVDIAAKPSVTVSAPTGTITTSAAPDVSWTYTDTDNETQAYYQIKVFTSAQYGAGGFNAATSTATWDSGEIASDDSTAVIGTLLRPDTYRAYVRVAKAVNGTPFWSDYAYSQFTISYTAPSIPTMAVSWSDTLGRASFTLTGTAPTGYVSQYYDIHRSDNGGTIFEGIRDGERLIPDGSYVATAQDYEAPRGLVAYYRVRSVGVDSNSNEFPSAWGTVQQVLITNDETWWFKAVENPSINTGSLRVLNTNGVTVLEPNTVVRPLGDDRPIVIAGPIQGKDGRLTILTIGDTEWDDFLPILEHQGTLLIQDPLEYQKYIRITGRTYSEVTQGGRTHRQIDIDYVEVDA